MELRPSQGIFPSAAFCATTDKQALVDRLPAFLIAFATLALDWDILAHEAPIRLHCQREILLSLHLLATFTEDDGGRHVLKTQLIFATHAGQIGATRDAHRP